MLGAEAGAGIADRPDLGRRLIALAGNGMEEEVREALAAGADPNCADSFGRSALHHAARFGYMEIARMLLEAGADPDLRDRQRETPLRWAVVEGGAEMAELLAEAGADPDARRGDRHTPLTLAARLGRAALPALLRARRGRDLREEDLDLLGNGPWPPSRGLLVAAFERERLSEAAEGAGAARPKIGL